MDPRPFTLCQLAWMDEGREEAVWWHTAAIITEIRNRSEGSDFILLSVHGNKNLKTPRLTDIRDVHPYESQRREAKRKKKSIIDLFSGWL